jgi:hypothetical protein
MATHRQAAWNLSPSRLRTYTAARMVYSFVGLPLDMIAEGAKESVLARFPNECAEDALPYHGRDRGIRRGMLEPAESYRARLLLWIESWRGAGVGRAMLDQLQGFLIPKKAKIRLWTQVGVVYTLDADGTFTIERATGDGWNWDGNASLWARFWVIFYSPIVDGDLDEDAPWDRDGDWGDGELWGTDPSATWGSTATIEQVQAVRGIIDDWRPAASVCKNIIVSFDRTAFDPSDTAPPLPDGTWGHWSINDAGVQVASRNDDAIYWDGVS